jgi:hypothetical protein
VLSIPVLHLAVRFVLELALLVSFGYWGWKTARGGIGGALLAVLAIAAPAVLWGMFRAPDDPSGGKPIFAIPGWARLALELILIGAGVVALWTSWSRAAAETMLTLFVLHNALIWERNWRLLQGGRRG